jgi:hypothetical protein
VQEFQEPNIQNQSHRLLDQLKQSVSSDLLVEKEGKYDINLNLLKISEKAEPKENLLGNITRPHYYRSTSKAARVGLPRRVKFDFNDPSVHQLNLTIQAVQVQPLAKPPVASNHGRDLDDSEGGRRDSQKFKFNDVRGSNKNSD